MAKIKSTRPAPRTRRALAGVPKAVRKAVRASDDARDANNEAHKLHNGLWDHLSTLQLVYRVVDHLEETGPPNEELSAVRNQLQRTVHECERLRAHAEDLSALLFRQQELAKGRKRAA